MTIFDNDNIIKKVFFFLCLLIISMLIRRAFIRIISLTTQIQKIEVMFTWIGIGINFSIFLKFVMVYIGISKFFQVFFIIKWLSNISWNNKIIAT